MPRIAEPSVGGAWDEDEGLQVCRDCELQMWKYCDLPDCPWHEPRPEDLDKQGELSSSTSLGLSLTQPPATSPLPKEKQKKKAKDEAILTAKIVKTEETEEQEKATETKEDGVKR